MAALSLGASAEELPGDALPHIVVIVGDDHGWPYSGFMGDPIVETPALDRLAEEGTVFTHGYSSASVCRPAMQTLLSGLSPHAWNERLAELRAELGPIPDRSEVVHFPTLPRRLADSGYRSFQGGKHWEGTFAMAGFDAGTTTVITAQPTSALSFARPSIAPLWAFVDGADPGPLLLWLAPMLPHRPLDPSPELQARYADRGLSNAAILYYANITRLDGIVGEIVAGLDARGMTEDTLVVYVSDNGWEQAPDESHFLGPLIGGPKGKLSAYELGFRTPIIFRWPGVVPAGVTIDDLAAFEDLHATLLDYGGAPGDAQGAGRSLRARIAGLADPVSTRIFGTMPRLRVTPEQLVFGESLRSDDRADFVRTNDWRLIRDPDTGASELYFLPDDPLEEVDRAFDEPEIVAALSGELTAWRATVLPEPGAAVLAVVAALVIAGLHAARRARTR